MTCFSFVLCSFWSVVERTFPDEFVFRNHSFLNRTTVYHQPHTHTNIKTKTTTTTTRGIILLDYRSVSRGWVVVGGRVSLCAVSPLQRGGTFTVITIGARQDNACCTSTYPTLHPSIGVDLCAVLFSLTHTHSLSLSLSSGRWSLVSYSHTDTPTHTHPHPPPQPCLQSCVSICFKKLVLPRVIIVTFRNVMRRDSSRVRVRGVVVYVGSQRRRYTVQTFQSIINLHIQHR